MSSNIDASGGSPYGWLGAEFHAASTPDPVATHRRLTEAIADEIRAAAKESERAKFLAATRIAAQCVAGCVIGLACMGWALHTTDAAAGGIAFAAGPLIGNAIILVALYRGARLWDESGW